MISYHDGKHKLVDERKLLSQDILLERLHNPDKGKRSLLLEGDRFATTLQKYFLFLYLSVIILFSVCE